MNTIAVAGLGLIGGSIVKALKANTKYNVLGYDINKDVISEAKACGIIDNNLTDENISQCDMVIVCLYPQDTVDFVKNRLDMFRKGTIIIDCCGVKGMICRSLSSLCAENGLSFIGGHPMAGIEKSGFEYSFSHMFDGATMIFCKDEFTDLVSLETAQNIFDDIGFLKTTITTWQEHDRVIAFTSQLPHIVSNAFIKSPQALERTGYSAGSYKDLTRVAWLNEGMWTELFFANKENILLETKGVIDRLQEYADALENNDTDKMKKLLADGKRAKEIIG